MAKDRAEGPAGGTMASAGSQSEGFKGLRLISPTFAYVILLLAAPLATVILYSFMTDGNNVVERPFTIANYVTVWTGKVYQAIMLRSLTVSMAVTLATVLLAYPIAYYVSFHVAPSRKSLWLFLITIPFWTSYIIRVFLCDDHDVGACLRALCDSADLCGAGKD
jgi:spermidine/putrescine transport system permease protein